MRALTWQEAWTGGLHGRRIRLRAENRNAWLWEPVGNPIEACRPPLARLEQRGLGMRAEKQHMSAGGSRDSKSLAAVTITQLTTLPGATKLYRLVPRSRSRNTQTSFSSLYDRRQQ